MKTFLKIFLCWAAGIAALAVIAIIVLAAGFLWWRHSFDRKIEAEIAKIRAEGYPTNAAELDAFYKEPPPGENAAEQLYRKAFATLKLDDFNKSKIPFLGTFKLIPGEPIPKNVLAEMDKCLKANAEALAIVDEAVKRKGCKFYVNLNRGYYTELPHLNGMLNITRLLIVSAVELGATGDGKKASEQLFKAMTVANAVNNEPLLISAAISWTCARRSTEGIAHLVNMNVFDADSIKLLLSKTHIRSKKQWLAK